jgi:hypothetical protein
LNARGHITDRYVRHISDRHPHQDWAIVDIDLKRLKRFLPFLDFSLRSENTKGAAHLGFSELSAIESTVILHFSYAVRQDQELGTELLKHMKNGKTAYLSSFSLACLLTMTRIHRFEDSVLDFLKSSILGVFKDQERMQKDSWVLRKLHSFSISLKDYDISC